ncbi:HNH endonuclease [Staphylococcus haemolyticus]|uniref:HNH endonuclease n=1 Tax=Staphylococcus haemolyticus TaxID=1283 RepID=UPI002902CCD3|nr:HNH endonuclease [Staphylococcus haemolyticus]MDU0441539.1 HNH endonuclease [Staphylococcus haemolyticus]MDU0473657.1 HNH endonuclease [Staphylococcus haemolyticus]
MKKCSKCKKIKSYDEFHKNSQTKDGYRSYCKECRKEYRRINKDKIREREKKRYLKNQKKLVQKAKEYRERNREQINTRRRERYNNDDEYREKTLNSNKNWANKNKHYLQLRQKEYYSKNKDELLRKNRLAYYERKDAWDHTRRQWRKNNIDKIYALNHSRRIRERQLIRNFTSKHWEEALIYFDNKCAYCLNETVLTRDHFIPIINGGNHTVDNIVPACKSCNCSKQDKDFDVWYEQTPFYNMEQKEKIYNYLKSVQ